MEALQDASFSPGLDKMKDAAIHGLHTDAVRQHLHDRLKVVTLRGVTIKGLDNALQNDDDRALKGFFLWLQDQLNDWSSPEPDVYRPQIQSFCDRLRNRHLEDKRIIDFFQLWKSAQAQIDASIQRRVLLVEDLLLQYLYRKKKNTPPPSSHPPVRQCAGPNLDQPHTKQPEKPLLSVDALTEKSRSGRENITAMEKRGAIEVSSGGKDSEVGFLGAKSPNGRPGHPMRKNKMKPKFPSSPVVQGAREILNGSYNDSHHPSSVVDTRRTEVENKVGKPNKGRYVCNRCHRPGHDLKKCPTNLDTSFDRPPPGGYVCSWCSAEEKHYATLCPRNENPDSWNQLRIKAGINSKLNLPKRDNYRPPYNKLKLADTERERKATRAMDGGLIHSDRLAMMEQDSDRYGRVDAVRNANGKRRYSRQQSPRDDQRSSRKEGKQFSLAPYKRFRQDFRERERNNSYVTGRERDNEREWDRRRECDYRIRFVSPAASRKISGKQGSPDLPPPRLHKNDKMLWRWDGDKDGRLSYWDDGYAHSSRTEGSPELQSFHKPSTPTLPPSPLKMNNQPPATSFWSGGNVEREIKVRFSDADPIWICEMASFDVDTFFDQMDNLMAARESSQAVQEVYSSMDTVKEAAKGDVYKPRLLNAHADIKESQCETPEEDEYSSSPCDTMVHAIKGPEGEILDKFEVAEIGFAQLNDQGEEGQAGVRLKGDESDTLTAVCGGDEIVVSDGNEETGREYDGGKTVADIS